ncbi:Unknown protein sequence [Pseudomonas syringae pv. maculicola]|nr:Unknown protein sequence [Pseudomonas syringae pv. maculicola]
MHCRTLRQALCFAVFSLSVPGAKKSAISPSVSPGLRVMNGP